MHELQNFNFEQLLQAPLNNLFRKGIFTHIYCSLFTTAKPGNNPSVQNQMTIKRIYGTYTQWYI